DRVHDEEQPVDRASGPRQTRSEWVGLLQHGKQMDRRMENTRGICSAPADGREDIRTPFQASTETWRTAAPKTGVVKLLSLELEASLVYEAARRFCRSISAA